MRIITEKADLRLGPEKLRDYGLKQLKRLEKAAKQAGDPGLASRLVSSRKRAGVKYDTFVSQATAAIQQLPDVLLVCANNPSCHEVDNTAALLKYIRAVTVLAQKEIRFLNRSSRLVYPSILVARKVTKPAGRAIKGERKRLIEKANSIPPAQSACFS